MNSKGKILKSKILFCFLLMSAVMYQAGAQKVNLSVNFSDTALQKQFTANASSKIEWVTNFGKGDLQSLKVNHIEGSSYTGADNAVRLTLAEPLSAGAKYNIVVSFFAPSKGNEGKSTLTGPGVVLNGAYHLSAYKMPAEFGTMPVDSWKEVNVTTPLMEEPITSVDFRFVINDKEKHADIWYIDSIVISQVGEIEVVKAAKWNISLPSLAKKYADKFLIGNILNPSDLNNSETLAMFKHQYAVVTAENDMKPQYLAPSRGNYHFSNADKLVSWAEENGILINGHTLVWHSQSAKWLTQNTDGSPLTREEARKNMEEYITTVVKHFKGKFLSWEVVNEAFDGGSGIPTDWKTVLRKDSPWYKAYENGANTSKGESGADYLYDAFVFARKADKDAVLYYNDYNMNEAWKREAVSLMIEEFNKKWKKTGFNFLSSRPLVEGAGMQSHYWVGDLNVSDVEKSIQRFIQAGVRVSITELDIPAGTYQNQAKPPLSAADELKQAQLYAQLFQIYLKYADNIERVTFWGKADSQSWRSFGSPLLFDRYFGPKKAFEAVMEPEGFLKQ